MGNAQQLRSFVGDDELWNDTFAKCTGCFPKNIGAQRPCLPQCVFTESGKGPPPIVREIFKGKEPPGTRPLFIIAYGPSGSGKSGMLRHLKKELGVDVEEKNTIEVNVDSLFQRKREFLEQMAALKKANPNPLYRQRLYQYYRWVADQISDVVLNQAVVGRFHVLWETTGENADWTEREVARLHCADYDTVLVWPLVSQQILEERVMAREAKTNQVAPTRDQLSKQVHASQKNLLHFLRTKECPDNILKELTCKLANCRPKRVILYDNENPDQPNLLYDSAMPAGAKRTEVLTRFKNVLKKLVQNEEFIKYFEGVT